MSALSRLVPAAAAALLASAPSGARADTLRPEEMAHLLAGDTVSRPHEIETESRRWVGGVAYAILDASAEELWALSEDVGALREILPLGRAARQVDARGGDRFVAIEQGKGLFGINYTLRIRADRGSGKIRFWLDPKRAHDLDDIFGYFRYEPLGPRRVLLVYGVMVDLGSGAASLFESKVGELMLTVPERMQRAIRRRWPR